MKIKSLLIVCSIMLVGCNSTEELIVKCTSDMNWTELGETTAAAGQHVRTFDKYKNACDEKLPEQAQSQYVAGYTKGIKGYCTYKNGFELAWEGEKNTNVCPFEIRAEFNKGFEAAFQEREEHFRKAKVHEEERIKRQSERVMQSFKER